jgi:hypothetical protein
LLIDTQIIIKKTGDIKVLKILPILLAITFASPMAQTSEPKQLELEHALLMEISKEIKGTLRSKYNLRVVQYDCDSIKNIELITLPSGSEYLSEGHAFKITVQLRLYQDGKPKQAFITLDNNNDTATFTVKDIKIAELNAEFKCGLRLYP